MGESSPFLLSKWYLDCIAENGDGVIVYVADLRWKAWQLRYASTLRFFGDKVQSASSIRKCSLPESVNGNEQIALKLPHLGLDGAWSGLATPIQRTVFESNRGAIYWNCLQPASRVRLHLDHTTEMNGLGYAELLQISVPPWKLPLNELHWGRFVAEGESLVWIDWRGTYARRILVHNGTELQSGSVTNDVIRSPDLRLDLALDHGFVLRSGALGETVFSGIARLARALPASILGVRESKWRSRGTLTCGKRKAQGWAIHEIVKWKQE